MAKPLRLTTVNARGLLDIRKSFGPLCERLLSNRIAIALVQETHIANPAMQRRLSKFWKGGFYCSYGTNMARGVAILIDSSLDCKVIKETKDAHGRLLILDLDIHETRLRIINIYAPNENRPKRAFLESLREYCDTPRRIIIGGDFNHVPDDMDSSSERTSRDHLIGSEEVTRLCHDFHLKDAFRHKYPGLREYTWKRSERGDGVERRLDRFYIQKPLHNQVALVEHSFCSFSDHKYVDLCLSDIYAPLLRQDREAGHWKLNSELLDNAEVCAQIEAVWRDHYDREPLLDVPMWEGFKECCRQIFRNEGKRLAAERRETTRDLEREIGFLERHGVDSDEERERLVEMKASLRSLLEVKFRGAAVRARVKVMEEDERPGKAFLTLETAIKSRQTITEMKSNDGTVLTTQEQIHEHITDFYSQLYRATENSPEEAELRKAEIREYLRTVGMPRLDAEQMRSCEGDLTAEALWKAIKTSPKNKAPGYSGLTNEFYKKFFPLFGEKFTAMLNRCRWATGEEHALPGSHRRALITLLCKDPNNADDINFWRPLTLEECELKFITKHLFSRAQKVIHAIIHTDQTGSVPGRTIEENNRLLDDMINFFIDRARKWPGAFAALDQRKAYDLMKRIFMEVVLEVAGFGIDYRTWMKLVYQNRESAVIVNGVIGKFFGIDRGVLQGDSNSGLIFNLSQEPFTASIRKSPIIKGFKIPGLVCDAKKINAYADDNTPILAGDNIAEQFTEVRRLFLEYGRHSGAELNEAKCEGMFIGISAERLARDAAEHAAREAQRVAMLEVAGLPVTAATPFQWPVVAGLPFKECVKVLGIRYYVDGSTDKNWTPVTAKIKSVLAAHANRHLTLRGKALIVNTLAASKIWYVGATILMPATTMRQLQKWFTAFIWGTKAGHARRHELSESKLIVPWKEGGLGLVCVELKMKAFRVMTVVKLILTHCRDKDGNMPTGPAPWTHLPMYWCRPDIARVVRLEPGFGPVGLNTAGQGSVQGLIQREKPPYWKSAMAEFNEYVAQAKILEMPHDAKMRHLRSLSVGKITRLLIKTKTATLQHRIEHKYPGVSTFKQQWQDCADETLDPFLRNFMFRCAHECLPTNDMRQDNMQKLCPLCQRVEETVPHVLMLCSKIQRIWAVAEHVVEKLRGLCNHRLKLSPNLLFRGGLPKDTPKRGAILFLINTTAHQIWKHRNEVLKDHKPRDRAVVLRGLVEATISQLEVDKARLPWETFHGRWGPVFYTNLTSDGPLAYQPWLTDIHALDRRLLDDGRRVPDPDEPSTGHVRQIAG